MSKRPILSTRWAIRLAFLALLLLTIWHYQSSLHFGFWWDDPVWYSHMRGRTWWELLRPTPEFEQYYRPGTMLYVSFFLRDDGTYDAFALHWLQIGWHLLQVTLSFATARLLKLRPLPAFFVALLVALFPFSYQATAWAAPQQPMAAAFQGGAWLLFLLGTRQRRRGWMPPCPSASRTSRATAKSQKDQLLGQFIGLPGTMQFYSFVGIFVTSAAVVAFDDVLIAEDALWDPVSLISKFKSPGVVIFAQIAMLIATLSTNIAANVIAPANAFSNLFPKKISFRVGGVIAGLVGIVICPWWLMNEISGILIFISGLLGPVLGILLCDYFIIRKRTLVIVDLYKVDGPYAGVNSAAMIALVAGVLVALIGYWVKPLEFLYTLSWFSGTAVAFAMYWAVIKLRS